MKKIHIKEYGSINYVPLLASSHGSIDDAHLLLENRSGKKPHPPASPPSARSAISSPLLAKPKIQVTRYRTRLFQLGLVYIEVWLEGIEKTEKINSAACLDRMM
jgi:hypothetical protein